MPGSNSLSSIQHIVVLMLENRSFDHMLGFLYTGNGNVSPAGQPYDPALHEAVATAPAPEGQPSGTVIEVYQPGYRLGASIIRPARVVVAG